MRNSGVDGAARRRSRRLIIQVLYQWQLTQNDLSDLMAQFLPEAHSVNADIDYFKRIAMDLFDHMVLLDQTISSHISRDISEITMIEHAVLRLGAYELLYCLDIPYVVVINEALELNKRFGTKDGHKFVNGVLDSLAKAHRSDECASRDVDG
jgi:transcription antitermination protein NusB